MVLRSSAWSLPWEKVILMMLLTPFGVDLWNTLLYHLEALQLSFSPFFLCSFPTLSEGYNTRYRYCSSLCYNVPNCVWSGLLCSRLEVACQGKEETLCLTLIKRSQEMQCQSLLV